MNLVLTARHVLAKLSNIMISMEARSDDGSLVICKRLIVCFLQR